MNNIVGQPTIVPLSIPDGWCPSGTTWQSILQEYQDKFLAGATIQIPGFGSVDLTTLAQLVQTVAQQGAQIAALTKATRVGLGETITTLNGVTTVAFDPMPSTSYFVDLTLIDAGAAVTAGTLELTLVPGSKQLGQFQVRSNNVPTTFTFDWRATQI